MLENLLIGLSTMTVCLLLQALLMTAALRHYTSHESMVNSPSAWTTLVVISVIMILLVLGNLGQLFIWALVFQFLGEFSTLSEAVYHSAVNFATLGYGDIVMSERYRLLGPLEAINGVLMIGVSTAALITTFQDALRKTYQARHSG